MLAAMILQRETRLKASAPATLVDALPYVAEIELSEEEGTKVAPSALDSAMGLNMLVIGSGDYRSAQACVRLTRVLGVLHVTHYEGGLSDWVGHRGEVVTFT